MALAESDVKLGLYIGESFAEAHLSQNHKSISFHRWYLGKTGLKSGLQKILQESGIQKIDKAYVASRFLEKIFNYRLGGSVATVTTKGFENWPAIRQPLTHKVGPLSSTELFFTLDERCDSRGRLEKEPQDEELAELVEKLKQKQAKRVCIHFLNADKNPTNQQKVKHCLQEAGFEVFTPQAEQGVNDEVAVWRKNLLNASLSGTFEEIQEEINSALEAFLPESQRAQFISGEGHYFDKENHYRLSSLWGANHTWSCNLKRSDKFDILYLGLEQFSLFYPGKKTTSWYSPWGRVHSLQVKNYDLSLQPTTAIGLSPWNEFAFSKSTLGYEPGPIFMGRGQVPTLLDLWGAETEGIQGVDERRSTQGLQKFKNQIWALNKSTAQPLDSEEKVISSLRHYALQKISADIILHSETKKLVCLGALAPVFSKALKKQLPEYDFEILPESEASLLLSQGT